MTTDRNQPSDKQPNEVTAKPRPCHVVKMGAVKAAVWKRQLEGGTSLYNSTLTRLYRDHDGNWAESTSFNRDELLAVSLVASEAFKWICAAQQRDRRGPNDDVPS